MQYMHPLFFSYFFCLVFFADDFTNVYWIPDDAAAFWISANASLGVGNIGFSAHLQSKISFMIATEAWTQLRVAKEYEPDKKQDILADHQIAWINFLNIFLRSDFTGKKTAFPPPFF